MRVLEFAKLVRAYPGQSILRLSELAECSVKNCEKFLRQLETNVKKGRDPVTGRRGVKLYSLALPKAKRAALNKGERT